jgi:hypothetical protein
MDMIREIREEFSGIPRLWNTRDFERQGMEMGEVRRRTS